MRAFSAVSRQQIDLWILADPAVATDVGPIFAATVLRFAVRQRVKPFAGNGFEQDSSGRFCLPVFLNCGLILTC
jgi:hypothetical protein